MTVAKPATRATAAPMSVAESGNRLGSPQSVQVVPVAWASRYGTGSVGPAVAYPEYSITVGHGAAALQVPP